MLAAHVQASAEAVADIVQGKAPAMQPGTRATQHTVGGSSSAATATRNSSAGVLQCPEWLAEYAAWHKEERGSPSAKYLIWTCLLQPSERVKAYRNTQWCDGAGDRLRGMLWTLRVAAGSRRVLFIMHDRPAPLEAYLEPALIDWRVDEQLRKRALSFSSEKGGEARHLHICSKQRPNTSPYKDVADGALIPGTGAWSNSTIITFDTVRERCRVHASSSHPMQCMAPPAAMGQPGATTLVVAP